MKEQLITSGYPRSGNTYLNSALNLLFYPNDKTNTTRHTVVAIDKASRIIVPFRNPTDAIASWHHYVGRQDLHMDISFYVRFYSHVLNNTSKIILFDFDRFTNNIDYITNTITQHFNVMPVSQVTDTQVKTYMIDNDEENKLPRSNYEELNKIKIVLQNMPEFQACMELHATLKSL